MDEKGFIEMLITERMGMHHDRFEKEYPPTPEQLADTEKANAAHGKIFTLLDAEHRDLLEFCEDVSVANASQENEYYYRAGVKDGVNLERLVKQLRDE